MPGPKTIDDLARDDDTLSNLDDEFSTNVEEDEEEEQDQWYDEEEDDDSDDAFDKRWYPD